MDMVCEWLQRGAGIVHCAGISMHNTGHAQKDTSNELSFIFLDVAALSFMHRTKQQWE